MVLTTTHPQIQVGDVDGVGQDNADSQQPGAQGAHEWWHAGFGRVKHEAVSVHSNQEEAQHRDVQGDVLWNKHTISIQVLTITVVTAPLVPVVSNNLQKARRSANMLWK